MNRKILRNLVSILVFVGFASVGWVIFDSMKPSQSAKEKAEYIVDLNALEVGQVKELKTNGGPLFVLKPSKEQMSDLKLLNDHVWRREFSGYDADNSVFIQRAISTIAGCPLEHHSKKEAKRVLKDNIWLGGYFDVCHDGNFDYAGRAIKTYKYSKNGGVRETPNLFVPKYEIKNKKIVINLL